MVNSYPLVMTNIAIENGPFIVDLPMKKMVIFHSYVSLPEGKRFTGAFYVGNEWVAGGCWDD